jgi:hypothetical protein
MADSLILKGVKDVRKHTGTDFLLRRPKGGGDQWKLKRWWINGQISTQYCSATVFDVGGMKLALNTSPSSIVRIDYDGTDFAFYGVRDIDYAALYTDDFQLIEYYVMPRLAGGKVMTVTPADAAERPGAGGDGGTDGGTDGGDGGGGDTVRSASAEPCETGARVKRNRRKKEEDS